MGVQSKQRLLAGLGCLGLALLAAIPISGATTGTTQLHMQQGADAGTRVGDYVSDTAGLNTYYSLFIEVPPSLPRLVVDIFDADWGLGGTGEAASGRDRARTTTFNSSATFSLLNPSGTAQTLNFTTSDNANPVGGDNAWLNLFDTNNIFPTFVASTVATANELATLTLTIPAGTAVGDVLVAAIARDLDGTTGTVTQPGGWTLLNEGDCPTATCTLAVYYRVLAAVPGSQTFTWTGNQKAAGAMFTFRGIDNTNPIDVAAATSTGTTANPASPAVTTTTYGTMVLRLFGAGPSLAFTPPAGPTEQWDAGVAGGANDTQVRGYLAYQTQGAAGSTGTPTFTVATTRWRALTVALRRASPVVAGHWELRIDSGAGDDINALGIRAHDGDSTSGGTEIPVYADSFFSYGVNAEEGASSSRAYTQYPWFTEGCRIEINTFDWDSGSSVPAPLTNTGSVSLVSRTGAFSQTDQPLSVDNSWDNVQLNAFTTNANSTEYGIWTQTTTINEYLPDGNSNYGVTYLGDDGLPNPPPTAQPEADAFRLYLPTDAGSAPVKPYLEQQLRWSCFGVTPPWGPNPPQIGQTSCFTITVRLVNPTSRAITFSTPTNIVTANVPGSGVTYRGNAQVSQGSVVSQPAVGGTGNVTWNPGSVAAGATALLSYAVNVAPVAAGTIVTTATHASGTGTRARYVDETGNTTQARATYELGPLCELAASTTAATPAVVFGFRAVPTSEGVLASWETASEVGTARFELQRLVAGGKSWVRVDDGRLVAAPQVFQGSVYRTVDRGADPRSVQSYRVVERDLWGGERIHGPFVVDPSREAFERESDFAAVTPRPLAGLAAKDSVVPSSTQRRPKVDAASGLKLGVGKAGITRVGATEIASGLGLSPSEVASRLLSKGFALSRGGAPVAWLPASAGDGLFFYGEPADSPYTAEGVYLLRPGTGVSMTLASGKPPAIQAMRSFTAHALAEQDRIPAMVLATDPESDYWFWQGLFASDPANDHGSFAVSAPGALPSSPANLHLALFGASTQGKNDHRVAVSLNGVPLGEVVFSGLSRYETDLAVPAGVVRAGDNTVELLATLSPGATQNDLFVDRFELFYTRDTTASNGTLEVATTGRRAVTVGGFPDSRLWVFDLADPLAPRLLKEAQISFSGADYLVSFGSGSEPGRYLVASQSAWLSPTWIRPDAPSSLATSDRGAEYLVVTAHDLVASAGALADLRAADGLSTAVVDIEDVYDEFNAGSPSPHALHDFLDFARTHWSPAPRYVVLAGNGDFDYRGLLGYGGNLVPPLLVATSYGLFASDAVLADLVGNDGIPDVAIGRLPVRNASELDAVVAKLAAQQASLAHPTGKALLVADDSEGGFDFSSDLALFQGWLPRGFAPQQVTLAPGGVAAARTQLFSALGSGADLLVYSGHGGLDRLASEGLLTTSDVTTLPATGETPLMVALTCVLNRFELPMLTPLGAALVVRPGAGAVAVWSATGISTHPAAPQLGRYFLDEMGRSPGARLGDSMLAAQARFAAAEGAELLTLYNLLGDPATRLAAPPPAPPAGTEPVGDRE